VRQLLFGEINRASVNIPIIMPCKVFVESPDKSEEKHRQNIHISYDLLGFLPELNTPIKEGMA
jgi:hypothetical protein